MARATVETLLSLDQWAQVLGISPWEFNQIGKGLPRLNTQQCPHIFMQFDWQQDFLSRERIAMAISDAEFAIANQLHYWPAPRYTVGETVEYPRPGNGMGYGGTHTWRWEWKSVQLEWGQFVGGGALARTALGDTTDMQFTDEDHDGLNETFTCSRPYTDNSNTDEIGVYFREADRADEPLDESWRIRPVQVSISGGVATVKGHISQLVKPELTLRYNPNNLNATEVLNFVDQVTFYRVFRDDTHSEDYPYQGVAEWDNLCECSPDCTFGVMPICLGERLTPQGYAYASFEMNCSWWSGWREPNRLNVNYLSGLPLVNGKVQSDWARLITYLSCALLPTEPCGCERSQRIIAYWREPERVNVNDAAAIRGFTPKEIDNNPFGSIGRGAIYTWKRIAPKRNVGAYSL